MSGREPFSGIRWRGRRASKQEADVGVQGYLFDGNDSHGAKSEKLRANMTRKLQTKKGTTDLFKRPKKGTPNPNEQLFRFPIEGHISISMSELRKHFEAAIKENGRPLTASELIKIETAQLKKSSPAMSIVVLNNVVTYLNKEGRISLILSENEQRLAHRINEKLGQNNSFASRASAYTNEGANLSDIVSLEFHGQLITFLRTTNTTINDISQRTAVELFKSATVNIKEILKIMNKQ